MDAQRRVFIDGRVQGVGYRASAAREAAKYPELKGFVRNLPDGRVEAVFCGEEAQVRNMVDWCRRGPSLARVLDIKINEEPCDSRLQKFRISHARD